MPLQMIAEEGVVGEVHYDEDGCYNPKEYMAVVNQGDQFQSYSDIIGVFMLFFGGFGIIGNSLSIFVLLKKEKICFNYLLAALNFFDTFHLIFAILDVVRNNHAEAYPEALLSVFPYFHYPLYRLSLCCSIFIIVSVTVERFLAVTRPHHRLLSNSSRALLYLIPCIIVSVALNFTKFFETETISYCMDFTACGCGYHERMYVRPTKLRLSPNYIVFYTTWTWVSMTSIIPFLILAILNWVIWRRLRAARETTKMLKLKSHDTHQDKEHKTSLSSTTILLCTVTMFLICHSPRLFLSVYEAAMINSILHCQSKRLGITPIWYLYAMASVQLLQVINTSLNFPIYWFVGNFRETFYNLFSFKQCLSTEPQRHLADWDTQMSAMSRQSSSLSINHGKIEIDIFEKILKSNNNSQSSS